MKKMIFSLLLCSATGIASYAQCNGKVTFNASKTDYLDAKGTVQQSKTENTLVNFDNQDVTILCNGEQITGSVVTSSCDWKKKFVEGKTILKANINGKNGDSKNATLTMEGKDGIVSLLVEVDDMPSRKYLLPVDDFGNQQ